MIKRPPTYLEAIEFGARLVIINARPTPYDQVADAVLRTPIGESLSTLVDLAVSKL